MVGHKVRVADRNDVESVIWFSQPLGVFPFLSIGVYFEVCVLFSHIGWLITGVVVVVDRCLAAVVYIRPDVHM